MTEFSGTQAEKLAREMEAINAAVGDSVMRIFTPLPTLKKICNRCERRNAPENSLLCPHCNTSYGEVHRAAREFYSDDPSGASRSVFQSVLAAIRAGDSNALIWLRDAVAEDVSAAAAQCIDDMADAPGYMEWFENYGG